MIFILGAASIAEVRLSRKRMWFELKASNKASQEGAVPAARKAAASDRSEVESPLLPPPYCFLEHTNNNTTTIRAFDFQARKRGGRISPERAFSVRSQTSQAEVLTTLAVAKTRPAGPPAAGVENTSQPAGSIREQ